MKSDVIVCYVVDNRPPSRSQCLTEVIFSCVSLKRHFSGKVIIFTNEIEMMKKTKLFDEVLPLSAKKDKRGLVTAGLEKILAIEQCLPNCIFLDTDTIILDDLSIVSEREEFDLAGVVAPYRGKFKDLKSFPMTERKKSCELNTGVLFVKGERGKEFISHWKEQQLVEINRPKLDSTDRLFDQISFMNAVEEMGDLFILRLPWNYNYRDNVRHPIITGKIFVQHYHHLQRKVDLKSINNYIDKVEKKLNGPK